MEKDPARQRPGRDTGDTHRRRRRSWYRGILVRLPLRDLVPIRKGGESSMLIMDAWVPGMHEWPLSR